MSGGASPGDKSCESFESLMARALGDTFVDSAAEREALLASYPEHAEALREFFSAHDAVGQAAVPLRDLLQFGNSGLPRAFGGYELLEERGRGGIGVVYRAKQLRPQRVVALKMLLAGSFAGTAELRRFEKEIEALAALCHSNIVPLFDVGSVDGVAYFTMEFVEGSNLAELAGERALPILDAVRYVRDAARAIQYAHSCGIVHRDLKPSNILVDRDGRPRVVDFGLSKRTGDVSRLTATQNVAGTPPYLAPEQIGQASKLPQPASDIHALGAILYELLTGRPPFRSDDLGELLRQVQYDDPLAIRTLAPRVSREMEAIVLKCLEKSPSQRYGTAGELADDLDRFLEGKSVLARRAGPVRRAVKWARRHPARAALLMTGVIAAAVIVNLLVVTISALNRVQATNLQLRYRAYATDMRHAIEAWEKADIGTVRRLLAEHLPANGATDIRGIEWHYVNNLVPRPERRYLGHRGPVFCLAVSHDGRLLASGGEDGTVRLWSLERHGPVGVLSGHKDDINQVLFSHDGRTLATGSDDGTVRLWDVSTRRSQHTIPLGHNVTTLAYSRDGALLAASGDEGNILLWDVREARQRHRVKESGDVTSLTFTPDGQSLVVASHVRSRESAIRLWNIQSATSRPVVEHHVGIITNVEFAPLASAQLLAAGCDDGRILLCDVERGGGVRTIAAQKDKIRTLAFSHDGARLASSSRDGTVVVRPWQVGVLRNPGSVRRLAASPDGRFVAAIRSDRGHVDLWDILFHKHLASLELAGPCERVCFSADSSHVVAVGASIDVWHVDTLRHIGQIPATEDPIRVVVASGDALSIAWVDVYGKLLEWNISNGQSNARRLVAEGVTLSAADVQLGRSLVAFVQNGHQRISFCDLGTLEPIADIETQLPVKSLQFSPDGRRLAAVLSDASMQIVDSSAFNLGKRFYVPDVDVQRVGFAPLNSLIVHTQSEGGRLWSWDASDERGPHSVLGGRRQIIDFACTPNSIIVWTEGDEKIHLSRLDGLDEPETLKGHEGQIWPLAFANDGRALVTGGFDGEIKRWPLPLVQRRSSAVPHDTEAARILPQGDLLITGGFNGASIAWSLEPVEPATVLDVMRGPIRAIALLTRNRVALAGASPDVVVVDATLGKRLAVLRNDSSDVHEVATHPGTRLIATGGISGKIVLWNADTYARIGSFAAHPGEISTLEFSPDGGQLASAGHDRTVRIWDIGHRTCRQVLRRHAQTVHAVAYSADGKVLASGSGDRTVRLWDVTSGRELAAFAHSDPVDVLAFSLDGKTLVTGTSNGIVEAFHVPSREPIGTLARCDGMIAHMAFTDDDQQLTVVTRDAQRATIVEQISVGAVSRPPLRVASGGRMLSSQFNLTDTIEIPETAERIITDCRRGKNGVIRGRLIVRGPLAVWQDGRQTRLAGGTLVVENGATVATYRTLFLSPRDRANPSAVVRGPNSRWLCGESLEFDLAPESQLTVEQGGRLDVADSLSIPAISGAKINVRGASSQVVVGGFLNVLGGTINVQDGGTLRSSSAMVNNGNAATPNTATIDVVGAGSSWQIQNSIWIGGDEGPHGSACVMVRDRAALESKVDVIVRMGGTLALAGCKFTAPSVKLEGGRCEGFGFVRGNVANGGTVAVDCSGGSLEIVGSYEQFPNGRLEVTISPLSRQMDPQSLIHASGPAHFDGTLVVRLDQGCSPQIGDRFALFAAESISGEFQMVELPTLSDGLTWRLSIENQLVSLGVDAQSTEGGRAR